MQLQPIVGTTCPECSKRILFLADGTNCARCGLAHHVPCAESHTGHCSGVPALAPPPADLLPARPFEWTLRGLVPIAAGVFACAAGVGRMSLSEPPTGAVGASPTPITPGTDAIAVGLVGLGLVVALGSFLLERARQNAESAAPR